MFGKRKRELQQVESDIAKTLKRIQAKRAGAISAMGKAVDAANRVPKGEA